MKTITFSLVEGCWAVARLPADAPIPCWLALDATTFFCIARSADELSIVCAASLVPPGILAKRDWALLKLHGPFQFSDTGVLVAFANPLAAAAIGIFAISTFDTDYLLVDGAQAERHARY